MRRNAKYEIPNITYIIPYNDANDAVLTVSIPAVAGFEVGNIQNRERGRGWRSASTADVIITGVWPDNRVLSGMLLHRHLNHDASLQYRLFSDAGATSGVYDSTVVSALPYTAGETYVNSRGTNDPYKSLLPYYLWHPEHTVRSFKLLFTGSPAQAYFYVEQLCIGRYWSLDVNPDVGLALGKSDVSQPARRTYSGTKRGRKGDSWRTLNGTFSGIREAEMGTWLDLLEAGGNNDVAMSIFPGHGTRIEAMYTILGSFSSLDSIGMETNRFTKRFSLEEN